jgi:hypothetical protein
MNIKNCLLEGLVVELALQLLRLCHLPHGLHEVLLQHVLSLVPSDGKIRAKSLEPPVIF